MPDNCSLKEERVTVAHIFEVSVLAQWASYSRSGVEEGPTDQSCNLSLDGTQRMRGGARK